MKPSESDKQVDTEIQYADRPTNTTFSGGEGDWVGPGPPNVQNWPLQDWGCTPGQLYPSGTLDPATMPAVEEESTKWTAEPDGRPVSWRRA